MEYGRIKDCNFGHDHYIWEGLMKEVMFDKHPQDKRVKH